MKFGGYEHEYCPSSKRQQKICSLQLKSAGTDSHQTFGCFPQPILYYKPITIHRYSSHASFALDNNSLALLRNGFIISARIYGNLKQFHGKGSHSHSPCQWQANTGIKPFQLLIFDLVDVMAAPLQVTV